VRSVPIPTINEDELLIKGAYFPCNSLTVALMLFQSHVAVSTLAFIDALRMNRTLRRDMRD
jgi:hypothetical protein